MGRYRYNSDTLWRLYGIGGAELALQYAELSSRRAAETEDTEPEEDVTSVEHDEPTVVEDEAEPSTDFPWTRFSGITTPTFPSVHSGIARSTPSIFDRFQAAGAADDATSEPAPTGLGLQGWLNRLSHEFGGSRTGSAFEPSQPLDDMAKLRRLMAIDSRYLWKMPTTQVGLATPGLVQELNEIAADYRTLLEAGPPSNGLFTADQVRTKIADVQKSTARACEALRDYPQAIEHYSAAAELYAALGKSAEAQDCRANLARLGFEQDGNVDGEIKRLRAQLAAQVPGTIDYAEALVELAGVLSSNGDDYEAEKLLLEAEELLDRVVGDPSGSDLAAALTDSLLSASRGDSAGSMRIITAMKANGLYRQLSLALARIYQDSRPLKAAHYRARAVERDSRANNDDFSERMRRALRGELGGA